jgi:hypothetical protein
MAVLLFLALLALPAAAAEGDDQEVATEGAEEKTLVELPAWLERITLTGTFEADFTWAEHNDVTVKDSDNTTDLFVSTLELGMETHFTDWICGNIILLAEDVGTEDETDVTVDEAFLTFQTESFPLYLTFGKRALPFGVYESHLVQDPMTQDAYETNRVGITVGFTGPSDLDVSATLYKGEEHINHLFDSGLFDTGVVSRSGDATDDLESLILSATIAPFQNDFVYLTLFGAYLSESGRGTKNETLDFGLSFVLPFLENVRLDAEYIKALDREVYAGATGEFEEGVLSLGASYVFVLREREVIGGALFAERKAHTVAEPVELAIRYERFEDDGLADDLGAWSVEHRYGIGGRYTFYQNEVLSAYVGAEYRMTEYRVDSSIKDTMDDENNEVFVRLGLTF